MRAIDVGTVCIKTTGREAGQKVVVREIKDENFVVVQGAEGSAVRKRRCNIGHLMPVVPGAEHKSHKGKMKKK